MKKTIQVAALIVLTAGVVYAGVISSHGDITKCNKEWEAGHGHDVVKGEKDSSQIGFLEQKSK